MINAGFDKGSLFGLTHFLFYISDLSKILISLVKIYSDDTTLYGCTFKKLNDKSKTVDLYADLVLTEKKGEKLTGIIQCLPNKFSNVLSPPVKYLLKS